MAGAEASIVLHVLKKFIRSIRISSTSFKDIHKALNDQLQWLVALQKDTEREVSRDVLKDPTNVYLLWVDNVLNIENEVTSLNEKYEKFMRGKWKIWKKSRLKMRNKRILRKVNKLVKEFPKKILEDKPERVIKESGVPSFDLEEYPALKKALKEIQDNLSLQSKNVECVALHEQEGVGQTIIMQKLNDYFYDKAEFDVVIFIKLPADEKTDLHILQKIADRIKVDREGDVSEVARRIRSILEDKRYLLILEGVKYPLDGILEGLGISDKQDSKVMKDNKVVIATHYSLALQSSCINTVVKLERLSPYEEWKIFQDIVGDKMASPREGGSSSNSISAIGKLDQLVQYMLSLIKIWSFSHLILSYPFRIGHEDFLKQWINDVYKLCFADEDDDDDANIASLKGRVTHQLSESPLIYAQTIIPKEIINGGSINMETPIEDVPEPILHLATHLALQQLTHTLMSNTLPYSQISLDEKIRHIWLSTSNDEEKRTVVGNIQENSQIRSAFDHVLVIDLSRIDDETQRELELSSLKTRLEQNSKAGSPANHNARSRLLVLVVDGDYVDKQLDPQKLSLPIIRNSEHVIVFITTRSSSNELSKKVDLTIKTEDHLLPWELFNKIVGSELLQSSSVIREFAVKIVEKCGGHLHAIILMAKSLKDVKDFQIWELALEKLCDRDREAVVNAFFNIIRADVGSEREKIHLLKCLMVFKFQDLMLSDDQLFARWFSLQLVESEEEAKHILQKLVECFVLLQFEGPLGRYILLPEDIKVILHALGEGILDNLSEESLESTISNNQVLKLAYTDMRNLYDVSNLPQLKELILQVCELEALPEAIFKLQKLETLSLEQCFQLLEISPRIAGLENLKELRLTGCERLESLPPEIWKLLKLEALSLEHYSQLQELPPQISELENLKELRLARCESLKTLPGEIGKLQKLEILSLENCFQWLKLPPQVAELEYLRELRLVGCDQLETLPQEIFELQKLEALSLEGCWQLQELPQRIAKLENLKELRLAGCKKLKTLPEEIGKLHKLETLSLEHCSQLKELPQEITELQNLRELRLAGCKKLETVPEKIWELPNLQTLSLAGTSIFPKSESQELINSDNYSPPSGYHENSGHDKKEIPSSSSDITQTNFPLKFKVDGGLKQLCQSIMQLQIQNLEIYDLSGTHITDLPQVLDFPNLKSLLLRNNPNLIKIPSSFFDHVPLLSILNLSGTSIHDLPSSIFNLQRLKEFYLRDCKLLRELPSEISRLRNLTQLDLDSTLITHLPKEIQWLRKLESLCLTFYDDASHDTDFKMIPTGVLSQLTNLKVLKIGVNSDNEWWSKNFEDILEQIYKLEMLQELDLYIPAEVNFSTSTKRDLSEFRFIIGHHKPKLISRVPHGIEEIFKKSGRSLKFENGENFPHEAKSILSKARAFFLDHHMKINDLNQFGLENLKQVQLCILVECNEMLSIVDVDEYESLSMKFLTIFYMKNLRSFIDRPFLGSIMFCELKLLALHTCPELTTIFTMDFLHSLVNLEELIVADCPKVSSIISCSSETSSEFFLPKLRKLSLIFVPKLVSISNGVRIGEDLEEVGLYYCPKLQVDVTAELSSVKLKVIRAETEWWEQQELPQKFNQIFTPVDKNLDIFTQLSTYELSSFNEEDHSE